MTDSLASSSFHIVASPLCSLPPIVASLNFIYDSFILIEFMLFMHMHLNNCLLNFLGSRFKVEFECA